MDGPQRLSLAGPSPRAAPARVTRHPTCALGTGTFNLISVSALMPKDENPKNYAALPVSDVAELLGVTDRQVRNWIKDKGLPARDDPRGRMLDWPTTLKWYVAFQIASTGGNGGNRRGRAVPGPDAEEDEDFNAAVLRKTVAEADLKELQLAREQAQVVAVADVEKVLSAANKSIQTLILALPSTLTPQLIGMEDRNKIHAIIDRAARNTLGNLANIDAVRQARTAPAEDEEE
jgi:phage terminase Nu1 subunit (DNA packaging protein)